MSYKIISLLAQEKVKVNNQELTAIYDKIWQNAKPRIQKQQLELDPYRSKGLVDPRRGLTLLIDFATVATPEILKLLKEAQKIEPNQSWYAKENLHLSLYSLIDFDDQDEEKVLSFEFLQKYQKVIEEAVSDFPAFEVSLKGITAGSGAVLVQGFSDGWLQKLRDRINQALIKHNLPLYNRTILNHISILRYSKPITNVSNFCDFIAANRDKPLGKVFIKAVKFVKNDWYNSPDKTRLIKEYNLVAL